MSQDQQETAGDTIDGVVDSQNKKNNFSNTAISNSSSSNTCNNKFSQQCNNQHFKIGGNVNANGPSGSGSGSDGDGGGCQSTIVNIDIFDDQLSTSSISSNSRVSFDAPSSASPIMSLNDGNGSGGGSVGGIDAGGGIISEVSGIDVNLMHFPASGGGSRSSSSGNFSVGASGADSSGSL